MNIKKPTFLLFFLKNIYFHFFRNLKGSSKLNSAILFNFIFNRNSYLYNLTELVQITIFLQIYLQRTKILSLALKIVILNLQYNV